jgi:hypothetical protein
MISRHKSTSANQSPAPPNAEHPSHLSSEHMEALLRPSAFRIQASTHLKSCTNCREEVETISALLSEFRVASLLYAEQKQPSCAVSQPGKPRSALLPSRWSLASGVLACIVAMLPLVRLLKPTRPVEPVSAAKTGSTEAIEVSDEALLEDVRNDLSQSVPAPLQLLAATQSQASASSTTAGLVSPETSTVKH